MCGVVAIFAYDKDALPVDPLELVRIRDRMRSRGPDDAGIWMSDDGRLGLAHRRLSIIDLSDKGHQPMSSADGRFHIVFNGEIYNYRSLRADLEKKGAQFRSHSDTEVLLQLYAEKGRAIALRNRGGEHSFILRRACILCEPEGDRVELV